MGLTLADVKYLAPHLRDDWFMLTISFFRNFAAGRTLHSTRPLVARVINDLAKKDLCEAETMSRMTEKERDQKIQSIIRWAEVKANKSEIDLLLEALDAQVQRALKEGVYTGQHWRELTSPAKRLVELKVKRALPALLRLVEVSSARGKELPASVRPPLNSFQQTEILRLCRKLDPEGTKQGIRGILTDQGAGLRAQAALVLFRTGEMQKAREVLGGALEQAGAPGDISKTLLGWMFPEVIDELMSDGTPESRQAAARILKNGDFTWIGSRDRVPILRRFADAKMLEPYQFYLSMLEVKGNKLHGFDYRHPVAEVFAGEVLYEFAPNQPGNTRRDPNRNANREVAEARSWLQARLRELEVRNKKNP